MPSRSDHPKYELLEVCGAGGMGVVYRARDRQLNRIVALKFLGPGTARSAEAIGRFRREAEAIAALNHPNVATLFEAGEWDDEPFLALEYLSGGTLSTRLRPGGLSLATLVQYSTQLGAGLAYAHEQGILHRDVKPSNGMFSSHGALKLVDFGLAKSDASAVTDVSRTGVAVGTVAYMAPELFDDGEATTASDLYSFGAVVYEMAAGRPIYGGSNASLVRQILTGSPVPLAVLRPDLPSTFTDAVTRAISRDPAARFASVQEFLDQLDGSSGRAIWNDATPTASIPQIKTDTATQTLVIPNRARLNRPLAWLCAALLGIGAIFGIVHFVPGPQHERETLVVLPFENLGADPTNQSLCDGLQETVTSILSRPEAANSGIELVPSSEIRRSQIRTIADARKQFNATLALTGSVQKTPGGLQVTLNVSDAAAKRQKDSRILTVPSAEIAELPERLAGELRSLLRTSSLSGTLASATGQTTKNSTAYNLFLQGNGALESRNYSQAATLLKKALDADPAFALARAKLAETYLRINAASKDPKWLAMADAEVNRAAESGSTPEILLARALIRNATGDFPQAIALLTQLTQVDPTNVEAYRHLAESLDAAGRTTEAEATYQRAVRLRPGYWPTYESLGTFYMNKQQFAKAESSFQTGLGVAPDAYSLHYNLGALYFNMSRWDEAGKELERSIAIRPSGYAYANLGTVLFFQRKYPEAAKQLEEATKLQPANAQSWGNLGDAYWQIPGQRKTALQAFETAARLASEQLAINPARTALRKSYALYLAKLGRSNEALSEIGKALAETPKDMYVQFYAARVYAVTGDLAKSRAALTRSRELGYNLKEIGREPDLKSVR